MFLRVRAPRLGEAHTPRMDQGDRKNFIWVNDASHLCFVMLWVGVSCASWAKSSAQKSVSRVPLFQQGQRWKLDRGRCVMEVPLACKTTPRIGNGRRPVVKVAIWCPPYIFLSRSLILPALYHLVIAMKLQSMCPLVSSSGWWTNRLSVYLINWLRNCSPLSSTLSFLFNCRSLLSCILEFLEAAMFY
jgi:hypothetical protein